MRIAVCDDDELELSCILKLIDEYRIIHGINIESRAFHNSTDFIYEIKEEKYDLVLMDVLMPYKQHKS